MQLFVCDFFLSECKLFAKIKFFLGVEIAPVVRIPLLNQIQQKILALNLMREDTEMYHQKRVCDVVEKCSVVA